MILDDIELNGGDIFFIDKNEIACPIFLEDCNIFVLKIPSVLLDKIILQYIITMTTFLNRLKPFT